MRNWSHPHPIGMRKLARGLFHVAILATLCAGCIFKPDAGVTIIASPELLDFGAIQNELLLSVNKNFSTTYMGPVVIGASADWLIVDDCASTGDECYTDGPSDSLQIPVKIDRNRTVLGANRATLVLNAAGASQRVIDVFVEDLLQIQFDANKRRAKPNELLLFTDKTLVNTGTKITAWEWNFGDGGTSTSKNPQHAYAAPGVYDVTLKVTTANGISESFTFVSMITVESSKPTVDFTATPRMLLAGGQVRFTQLISSPDAPVRSFQWNFGDGGSSTDANPIYNYNTPGVYTVSLSVTTDFATETATKNQYIVVNPKIAPTARFTASTLNGFVNIPIQFTDISSPGSAPIDTWQWNFGDGGTSSQQNPQHAFGDIGTYTVSLTVTSAHGSGTTTVDVTVNFKPPVADFATLDALTNPAVGENLQFLDLSVPGSQPINSWRWTFGDGSTSTQQNPIKTYTKVGAYTVSLTVKQPTASNNEDTESKTAYISVFAPPIPRFNLGTNSVYVGKQVKFNNTTAPGGGTNLAYQWDFDGDGNTDSTVASPNHTYTQAGTYNAMLTATVTRPLSGGSYSVSTIREVVVDSPPVADFSSDVTTLKANDPINFSDESTPGTTPILGWDWNFGDSNGSTEQNPQHVYATQGQYTVRLSITTEHSGTGVPLVTTVTKTNYVSVTPPVPPVADFTADPLVINAGQNVAFENESNLGTGSGVTYLWDFGDGSTSTQANPTHVYNVLGDFTISLTVTTSDGTDTATRTDYVTIRNTTDVLQEYVDMVDPNFGYTIIEEGVFEVQAIAEDVNILIVDMTSQKWRDISEYFVTNTGTDIWQHYMIILVPSEVKSNKTMLFIEGGSNGGTPPSIASLDPNNDDFLQGLGLLAAATETVMTILQQVPNEPLSFMADSVDGVTPLRSRTEDEIIAFTFDQYLKGEGLKSNHETWPLLLPMVKSAVAAMDTVQSIYTQDMKIPPCTTCASGDANRHPVRDFFVSGGSKRGWTTWLTGASDDRVKAIAPLVIDVLNMDRQMEHHFAAYGYWSPSIYPYAQEQVFDRFLDPAAEPLLDIVDPFKYREKVAGIPKYLINSTGDQFFLPDSAQFYFDQLPGEKYLNYVANTGHDLGLGDGNLDIQDPESAVGALFSFYAGFVSNVTRPPLSWTFNEDGTITVSSTRPFISVAQWAANNPDARDFRRDTIGSAYVKTNLSPGPGNTFTTTISNSDVAEGWTAVYIQVQFENNSPIFDQFGVEVPFVFSTPVRVLPETEDGGNLYPEFNGRIEQISGPGFTIPVVVVQGSHFEMGVQYGELMGDEINALLPNMLAAAQLANPLLTNENLDSVWAAVEAAADPKVIEEISGIAEGSGLDFATVARANMVALLDQMTGTAISTTRDQVLGGVNGGLTVSSTTLDWTLDYGLQDYPCVVMYIPGFGLGVPHANVTFAGLAVSLAGMNLGGIMVGAVIDPDQPGDPTPSLFNGQHISTLNREILYDATSYGDLVNILSPYGTGTLVPQTEFLFRRQHLVASDGGNWRKSLKAKFSPEEVVGWEDDAGTEEPGFNALGRTSYSVSEGTGFQGTIFSVLNNNSGSITQQLLDSLTSTTTGNGNNLLNVQYEVNIGAGNVSLWVSYAQGNLEAKQFAPIQIRLTDFLP